MKTGEYWVKPKLKRDHYLLTRFHFDPKILEALEREHTTDQLMNSAHDNSGVRPASPVPKEEPDREAEADKCRAAFDARIKEAVLQGPPDTVEEVKARADKIMRAAGPLGFLGHADELKRCFRDPPDMDEYIRDTIDDVRQAKRARA
jgi:hypothetical protein